MSITVYAKDHCQQCKATERLMDRLGVDYDLINVDHDQAARDRIIDMGYHQTPVVLTSGDGAWCGFRPEKIKAVARELVSA